VEVARRAESDRTVAVGVREQEHVTEGGGGVPLQSMAPVQRATSRRSRRPLGLEISRQRWRYGPAAAVGAPGQRAFESGARGG
jgi:hypothetical protein